MAPSAPAVFYVRLASLAEIVLTFHVLFFGRLAVVINVAFWANIVARGVLAMIELCRCRDEQPFTALAPLSRMSASLAAMLVGGTLRYEFPITGHTGPGF